MSTPPPSTPAPEGRKPKSPESESLSVEHSSAAHSSSPPTLSPLSPESPAELEPISPGTKDNATLLAGPPQDAARSSEAAKKNEAAKKDGAGKRTKPYRWAVWLISFLSLGLIAVVLGLLYMAIGAISGTEFDAVYWTTRDFRFIRDPWTDTQLTDIQHNSSRAFTVDPVIAKHITGGPARPVHPRWDLVRINRGMSPGEGEALILLKYLQADDSQSKNYWIDWTTNHPQAAPILWGAVRDAVHLERYDRLPEIFDRVRVDDDPQALKEALSKVMLSLAVDEAQKRIKAGDRTGARRAALVGLSYGESEELQPLAADASTGQANDVPAGTDTNQEEN